MRKVFACGVICAALLAGCASPTPTKVDPASATPAKTAPAAAKAPETFKVGDKVKVGDQLLTVVSTRYLPGGQFLKPKDGTVWLALDCVVENVGSDAKTVSSLAQFKLADADGYQYMPTFAEGEKGDLNGNVAAGAKIRGEVVFEVPEKAKDVQLQFMNGLVGNPAIVKLGDIAAKQ